MKDKWMNMGYEEDELKPYVEPLPDLKDQKRIGKTGTVHKNQHLFKRKSINHFYKKRKKENQKKKENIFSILFKHLPEATTLFLYKTYY